MPGSEREMGGGARPLPNDKSSRNECCLLQINGQLHVREHMNLSNSNNEEQISLCCVRSILKTSCFIHFVEVSGVIELGPSSEPSC